MTTSIYDLYEFYLEPRDLKDKAHVVTVESVKVDNVINPRAHKPERKIVLRFVSRRKSMILNKTQAGAMMEITGTDDYNKWKGAEVVLVSGRAGNGKDTIVVTTRENSGDVELMYPPAKEAAKITPGVNIPKEWLDARCDEALTMAAKAWRVEKDRAFERIDQAVKADELSAFLPVEEFREYVGVK